MEKISVSIRVRPVDKQEAAKSLWKVNSNSIALCNASAAPSTNQVFVFDNVFGTESTTFDIYKATTQDIVASAIKGFNGTVFAYGQTSSGKTFTMRGTQDAPGIIPLAIQDVFKNLEKAIDREFLLRMSYMEIYNEDINDLLAPEQTKLQVHESLERGIFVAGLREEIVASPEQVLQLMESGEANRHVGETNMNVYSSRSHTIFRMVIESRDKSHDDSVGFSCDAVRVSVLNLVDLAGSERAAKTGAEGARLKEGSHINKSLMVLGTVINKLSEGNQNQGGHVPYRDSKLTRILQPALGGNARTAIICNITPAVVHVDESKGTLQFASRAIRVTNCAQVNEILTDAALLKRQKKEIEELRSKLKESHSEHLEEQILSLRNTLLKSECERERIALELQEEKRAHAVRERMQAQKIETLSTLVLNSAVEDREFEKCSKKNARRETWCPGLASGSLIEKDVNESAKGDRWIGQTRDWTSSLPPPFESLLEEESSNDKENGERCNEDIDKEGDNDYAPLPDRSTRMHVAERKRKHVPERPSDDFREELKFFRKAAYDSILQLSPLVSNKRVKMECESSNVEGSRSCQSRTAELETKDTIDEGIRLTDGTVRLQSTDSIIQQLAKELSEAKDEAGKYKEELISAVEKLKQLKKEGPGSMNKNEELEALLESLRKENQELGAQLTEAYIQFEEEKAAWVAVRRPLKEESPELSITSGGHETTELLKRDGQGSMKNNEELETLLESLRKENQELGSQLTEAYIQFEEEKAAWVATHKPSQEESPELSMTTGHETLEQLKFLERKLLETEEESRAAKLIAEEERLGRIETSNEVMTLRENLAKFAGELDAKKATEVTERRLPSIDEGFEGNTCFEIKEGENLSERVRELESLIVVLNSEKQENMGELDLLKSTVIEVQEKADAANAIADKARHEWEKVALEAKAMQESMDKLQTQMLQEKELREKESQELRQLKEELSLTRDMLGDCKAQSTKERWILKTEILKLQVCLDAMNAKSEVLHGRLLEVRDELKEAYEELDGLKRKQSRETFFNAGSVKTELPKESLSDAVKDKFEKERRKDTDVAVVSCMNNQNTNEHLTACNPTKSKCLRLEKENTQPAEKENMGSLAHGSQTKLMEETRLSSASLAHTVCMPVRNTTMKRQETKGSMIVAGQGQSRPRLLSLAVNGAAGGHRITSEVISLPAASKTCVMLSSGTGCPVGVKPPKPMPAQRNIVRSKVSSSNKDNR